LTKTSANRQHLNGKSAQRAGGTRYRILLAIGDAETFYTEQRIWRLVQQLHARADLEVISATSDEAVRKVAADFGVQAALIPLKPRRTTWDDQLSTVNELISTTADIIIPGSQLPLWKSIAPDEFRGSMLLFGARPELSLNVDLVIVPLMCVDSNTLTSAGLYTLIVSQARAQQIPVLGLEVSPLGNRYTMSQLPADHYAVKSVWSKKFLIRKGMASPEQISVLTPEEAALLRPGADSYVEAFFEKEALARQVLGLKENRFLVLIPHHVAFIWEVRQILRALAQVREPMTVAIQADSHTIRRQFTEPELIAKAYEAEIKALDHVVINTQVGVGLMAQMADLVVSPFAGTTTEGAALRRKPVIISQAMTEAASDGEFIHWQPDAGKIPEMIAAWRADGLLGRVRLRDAVRFTLQRRAQKAA
jgi:hypothetical protein